jgi:hypothetical protein
MLDEPEVDPALRALDRALLNAIRARLAAAPPARADAGALALRALLAQASVAEAAVVKAAWGRVSAATEAPLVVWGAAAQTLVADRHGLSARTAADPDQALAEALRGARAVLDIHPKQPWWGRLLARPELRVIAALPDEPTARPRALMVSGAPSGPSGEDRTFWVTDSGLDDTAIVEALGRAGLAASLLASAGGLKLFMLAGYVQAEDGRLSGAPGALSGVIGAAPVF